MLRYHLHMSSPSSSIKLSVLIPCADEGKRILEVLQGLKDALGSINHEVLVICDDPKDLTLPVLEDFKATYPQLIPLLNSTHPGVRGAVEVGLQAMRGRYVLLTVADDPGAAAIVAEMVRLLDAGYDLVNPTRYALGGAVHGGETINKLCSRWGNACFRILVPGAMTDATCGIKMLRREVLRKVRWTSHRGWTFVFELAVLALEQDFKIAEVPLVSYNRVGGNSHFGIGRVFAYAKIFFWGAAILWKKKLHA